MARDRHARNRPRGHSHTVQRASWPLGAADSTGPSGRHPTASHGPRFRMTRAPSVIPPGSVRSQQMNVAMSLGVARTRRRTASRNRVDIARRYSLDSNHPGDGRGRERSARRRHLRRCCCGGRLARRRRHHLAFGSGELTRNRERNPKGVRVFHAHREPPTGRVVCRSSRQRSNTVGGGQWALFTPIARTAHDHTHRECGGHC